MRRSSLPMSNLAALERQPLGDLRRISMQLASDAESLLAAAAPKDTRTRGIVNRMRVLSKWYKDVSQQRGC